MRRVSRDELFQLLTELAAETRKLLLQQKPKEAAKA